MSPWKLYDYSPEPGRVPVAEWYAEQDEDVQAEFDVAMRFFRANFDPSDEFGIRALKGDYLGLHEIEFVADLADGEHRFGAIGKWRPDSNQFVLFTICNKYDDSYDPCRNKALEYSRAWERKDPKGEIHEHPLEEIIEE